jgi:holo-[acyl-carrier protein] synthase
MAGSGALRVGLDLIEIERIRSALGRPRFRERCFTAAERSYCDSRPNPAESYAGRFASKEAVGKALGCGVNFTWKEIEIAGHPRPSVSLSGKTKAWAARMRVERIDLSMTHSKGMAGAVAILVFEEGD